jgi:tetratricopeptide (TPR) repeat protein
LRAAEGRRRPEPRRRRGTARRDRIREAVDQYLLEGDALLDAKRFEEAVEIFERAIDLDPHCGEAFAGLGHALREDVERLDAAIAAYSQAIEYDPGWSDIYLVRSYAFLALGRVDEALADATRAVELELATNDTEALVGEALVARGAALNAAGRVGEAADAYSKAIEIAEDNQDTEELTYIAKQLIEVCRSIPYTNGMDVASALKAAAARYGLSNDVVEAIGELAANAVRETTGRVTGKLTPAEIRKRRDEARLDGLLLECEERIDELMLPPDGFTTKTDADAAARLAATVREVQKLQSKLGRTRMETPERVKVGEAMASAYRRSHDKETGEVITPRGAGGRPRRWVVGHAR